MDILAARKKAADRVRGQKPKETAPPAEAQKPEAVTVQEGQAPSVATTPQNAGEEREPAAKQQAPVQEPPPASPEEKVSEAPVEQAALDLEMLSFRLGSEEYAVLVENVKEVLKNRELTALPNAPEHILGVTSLRGPILPVVDLSKRLGLPARERDDRSRILVITLNDEDTGIVVDRVTGVVRIPPASVRPAPETLEHGSEYLKGIARKDDRLYILLDIEKALAL